MTTLLQEFLTARTAELVTLDPALARIGAEVAELVAAGGKRLRPAFVYWGYRAGGGEDGDAVLAPAAAVELLHTFALIHDDVMDRSARRRGAPTVHERLAAAHRAEAMVGEATWFGIGGAILAGDLAFVWADQLFDAARFPAGVVDRARAVFTQLRVEVMAGQFLDLRLAGLPAPSEDDSLHVSLLKSGRYTVTRPLQLGAALASGDAALAEALAGFGDALGVAFQLRDDVLGMFGDPSATGKGALDDLREGKRTVLVLRALRLATPAQRGVLEGALGRQDLDEVDAERVRTVVVECGALDAVEQLLRHEQERALSCLERVENPARDALVELAGLAAFRLG